MSIATLRRLSVIYLLLPNLLFCMGWFRWEVAMVMLAGYGIAVGYFWRDEGSEKAVLTGLDLFLLAAVATLATFFSGVGGFVSQSIDWLAHHTKFYDLFKNPWPIYFPEAERYACYYFGYYLVPSFLSRLTGHLVPGFLIGWTALGFFLGMAWVFLLLNKNRILLLAFPFLRGCGQLFITLAKYLGLTTMHVSVFSPSLRSVYEQLTYVPNQVIPMLLACGMVLYDLTNRRPAAVSFFVITLTFTWAVFPATVLTLIWFVFFFKRDWKADSFMQLLATSWLYRLVIPGVTFLPVFVYFLSSERTAVSGFFWELKDASNPWLGLATGIFVDLLLLSLVIPALNKRSRFVPGWLVQVLFVAMLLLSVFRMGEFNDSFFRGSIPICIFLFIILLRGLLEVWEREKASFPVAFYVSIAILTMLALTQIVVKLPVLSRNVVADNLRQSHTMQVFPYDSYPNTYECIRIAYGDEAWAREYLAAERSVYASWLRPENSILNHLFR